MRPEITATFRNTQMVIVYSGSVVVRFSDKARKQTFKLAPITGKVPVSLNWLTTAGYEIVLHQSVGMTAV